MGIPTTVSTVDAKVRFKFEKGNKSTDYSPAPEDQIKYTDSQVTAAKAEIKVTTDGISTEVAKKVGSSEIISKINQSAETVKIQASKVEIDGTAIFNSISSDVDSAITSKGYATTGQVATAKSEAISSANSTTDTKLANYSTTQQVNTAISTAVDNMQEQTIYIQAVEGTLSVDPPSGWVDATSESVWYEYSSEDESTGAWTTPIWTAKRPTYRPEYPVTFVSTQRKRMDGTVESTLPLRDDTTTVIDGGHIVTGTIDANKVTVTNLNAGSINSGTLSAEYIDTEGLQVSLTSVSGLTQALAGKASSSDLSGVQSDLSTSIATATGSLTDRIAQIDGVGLPEGETGSVDNLDKRVVAFENHISFKNVVVDETLGEQPAIVLEADKAAPTGNVSTVLTNSALMFQEDGQTVAEITNQQLEITKTKVSESMQLGGFMWIPLSDGSLAFKWV